ncbi:MAG: hypothetical protein IKO48_07165 [Elusimicrobia bacterium]|nr:hypothetical protein [Elusimicrobiota bacterium]
MFGKIVDGKLIIARNKIEIKNGWVTNPTEEQLKDNGYKEVVRTERQNYDSETEKLVEVYKDNGKNIEISYTKTKLTNEEVNEKLQEQEDVELGKISQLDMLKAIVGDKEVVSKIEAVLKTVSSLENKKK